jgi:hypothetical protein
MWFVSAAEALLVLHAMPQTARTSIPGTLWLALFLMDFFKGRDW